jgi:radical SAM protein with 4Fe4S-binding SPASM domain
VGLYIRADGNIYPCESVAWESDAFCLGNLETHTLEQAWNAKPMKRLRQKIIRTGTCELSTPQKNSCMYLINFKLYEDTIKELMSKVGEDGTYPFNLQLLFLERSNICNLKCVYCCETSSSIWEKENGVVTRKVPEELYDSKLSPYLVHLKELFLSGGEPVIHPYNYKILKFLKKANPKVRLGIATNLTYSYEKYKDFFELYSSFAESKIFCSIDLNGERFEAIRINSKWDTVLLNLKELKKLNLKIYFNSVVSILNIPYIKQFHQEMINEKIIDVDGIRYLTLKGPECMDLRHLDEKKKQEYKIFILSYYAFLKGLESKKTIIDLYPNNKLPSEAISLIYNYTLKKPSTAKNINYRSELLKYISKETLERLFLKVL